MTGSGETAEHAAPKGNAKALRQKDRVVTILWKVRVWRTPTEQLPEEAGISQVNLWRRKIPHKGFCGSFIYFLGGNYERTETHPPL